jgi:acyl-CoA thioester hydrolase
MTREYSPPVSADYRFRFPLRVRWAEVDQQGIVFNPHYLAYADVAVAEYMRSVGFIYPGSFKNLGFDFVAVAVALTFLESAKFDDELTIGARVSRMGRTSFSFDVAIFRGDEALADVRLSYVNTTLVDRRPAPLPAEFIDKVQQLEG